MMHSGHLRNDPIVGSFSICEIWATINVLHDSNGVIKDLIRNFQLFSVKFIVRFDFLGHYVRKYCGYIR